MVNKYDLFIAIILTTTLGVLHSSLASTPKTVDYRHNETNNIMGEHRCQSDTDCDELRTCSSAGLCQGTAQPAPSASRPAPLSMAKTIKATTPIVAPIDIPDDDKNIIIHAMKQENCALLKNMPEIYKRWLQKVTHFTYKPTNYSPEELIQKIYQQGIASGSPIVQCIQTLLNQPSPGSNQPQAQSAPPAVTRN